MLNKNNMKCDSCINFMTGVDRCKFCHWEFDPGYNPWNKDDWDIFSINDDEEEWSHIQLLKRLRSNNIDCLFVDIWCDNNLAYIIGCVDNSEKIANVLNIHKDVIYLANDNAGLVILNLYQEKCIRKKERGDIDLNE